MELAFKIPIQQYPIYNNISLIIFGSPGEFALKKKTIQQYPTYSNTSLTIFYGPIQFEYKTPIQQCFGDPIKLSLIEGRIEGRWFITIRCV